MWLNLPDDLVTKLTEDLSAESKAQLLDIVQKAHACPQDLRDQFRKAAVEEYAYPSDDNIEIDDDAVVTQIVDSDYPDIRKAWVQAWVWVRLEDDAN